MSQSFFKVKWQEGNQCRQRLAVSGLKLCFVYVRLNVKKVFDSMNNTADYKISVKVQLDLNLKKNEQTEFS